MHRKQRLQTYCAVKFSSKNTIYACTFGHLKTLAIAESGRASLYFLQQVDALKFMKSAAAESTDSKLHLSIEVLRFMIIKLSFYAKYV